METERKRGSIVTNQREEPWKREFFEFGTRDLGDYSSFILLDDLQGQNPNLDIFD